MAISYDITNGRKINSFDTISGISDESNTKILVTLSDGEKLVSIADLKSILFNSMGSGAGLHNSIYRGKSLGSAVTDEQWAAIKAGMFDDMWIGDYWTIGDVNYRIAAFDYWLNTGDTACTTHHIVLVPDSNLYSAQMHNTNSGEYESGSANTTEGGYIGSDMYNTNLAAAKATINSAFGSAHILSHRETLVNAVTSGYPSNGSWYDSTVELMNEPMVYGSYIFTARNSETAVPYIYTVSKSQLPLFKFRPDFIGIRASWWLRDVVTAADCADVNSSGNCGCNGASYPYGVRPAFGICSL